MRQSKKSAKARQESQKRSKEAIFEEDIKKPRPKTWSARMPAYAGTVLCVDRRYRPRKEEEYLDGERVYKKRA